LGEAHVKLQKQNIFPCIFTVIYCATLLFPLWLGQHTSVMISAPFFALYHDLWFC